MNPEHPQCNMEIIKELTKDQRTLLLYLETRAVDYAGRVNTMHMNEADLEQAREWHNDGFLRFGRIIAKHCTADGGSWVDLTDAAWELAHAERRKRANRTWIRRNYVTTEEK